MSVEVANAIEKAAVALSENITLALKVLLETKHLYQSVSTSSDDDIVEAAVSTVDRFNTNRVETEIRKLYHEPWHALQPSQEYGGPFYAKSINVPRKLAFNILHVKLFCHKCDRIEAFNCLSGQDSLDFDVTGVALTHMENQPTTQIFILSFLCQSCKGIPEIFLVRREGNKLTLSGRSPIEHVGLPRVIPKPITNFFSGAIVAHQSGQTLAGVFLFRVFIEQWVQSQAKTSGLKVDQALDKYMENLPVDFKGRFPSFRAIYEELSVDIHSAKGSAELYEKTRQQIIEHFEARRLFKL